MNFCVPYLPIGLYLEAQRTSSSAKVQLPLMRIGAAEGIQPVGKVAHGGVRRKCRIECLHRHMYYVVEVWPCEPHSQFLANSPSNLMYTHCSHHLQVSIVQTDSTQHSEVLC